MKKGLFYMMFFSLIVGVGILQWTATLFCLNCFGTLPTFLGF